MASTPWWYLSFVDAESFRGACIVEGSSFIHAVLVTHLIGINPGGEVAGWQIPDSLTPEQHQRYRLFRTPEELTAAFGEVQRLGDMTDEELCRLGVDPKDVHRIKDGLSE